MRQRSERHLARRRRRPAAGFSLLELLVAASLTAMTAGAVLSLLVGGAATGAHGQERLANLMLVRAAADLLARDGTAACAGLEGAVAVVYEGHRIPCLQPRPPGGVRLIVVEDAPVEVQPTTWPRRYQLGRRVDWRRGDRVVALGVLGEGQPGPAAVVPLGTVVRVIRPRRRASARTGVAEVVFAAAEAGLLRAAPPRALAHVRVREYRALARAGGVSLRRQDDGGAWLPVLDGLASLLFADGGDGGAIRVVANAGRGVDAVAAVGWLAPPPARVVLAGGNPAAPGPDSSADADSPRGAGASPGAGSVPGSGSVP